MLASWANRKRTMSGFCEKIKLGYQNKVPAVLQIGNDMISLE